MKKLRLTKKEPLYVVHSSFLTIQGEGALTGRRAVFVRFSGCNVWSGKDKDRERDAKRNSACARICDTDFFGTDEENGGGVYTTDALIARVRDLWGFPGKYFVVFTGGEPGLQLTRDLVQAFGEDGAVMAVETNGTRRLPEGLFWVTLSPKPPMFVVEQHYSEVKVLSLYLHQAKDYEKHSLIRWVQPVDWGDEERNHQAKASCVEFVAENLGWGVSVQGHKWLGVE